MSLGNNKKNNSLSEGQTLHETVMTNFNKASTGKVYEKEIKDIYSMLLICLDLKEESNKCRFYSFSKGYPYSFSIDEALSKMRCLNASVCLSTTTTCMTYRIRQDLAWSLLNRFYEAKLIHSPADRTRSKPKYGTLLQPTPKGVAILQQFCKKIGLNKHDLPSILNSPFNSMDVFQFDRDSVSDKIVYSEYLLYILFMKMMGDKPNYWLSTNDPDPLPSLAERLDADNGYDFSTLNGISNQDIESAKGFQILNYKQNSNLEDDFLNDKASHEDWISPFHHRYFTNPESDSHVQYYVSNKGVRFYKVKSLIVGDESIDMRDCTTGKALCQWICDCTDVMTINHAMEIANLMLAANFICSVSSTLDSKYSDIYFDKNSYYTLTLQGRKIVNWNKKVDWERNSKSMTNSFLSRINYKEFASSSHHSLNATLKPDDDYFRNTDLTLKQILMDPGMKYLFKKHLELEYCSENLEAYLQIKQFEKRVNLLGKLLDVKKKTDTVLTQELDKKIFRVADSSLSLAYHIYFTYLNFEAPFVINIDYGLRKRISDVIMCSTKKSQLCSLTHSSDDLDYPNDSKKETPMRLGIPVEMKKQTTSPKGLPDSSPDLSIKAEGNIGQQGIQYPKHSIAIVSPMERSFHKTIKQLVDITPIFQDISKHIFRLMEIDSLGKFFKSEVYLSATSTLKSLNLPC